MGITTTLVRSQALAPTTIPLARRMMAGTSLARTSRRGQGRFHTVRSRPATTARSHGYTVRSGTRAPTTTGRMALAYVTDGLRRVARQCLVVSGFGAFGRR